MEQLSSVTVNGQTFEVVVAPSCSIGFIAWALVVRSDGRRDPVFDRNGAPLRETGPSASIAVERIEDQIRAMFPIRRR